MKAPKPDCSILIATHDRVDMLRHALRSAMAQTYQNIEIVVYDDASTDATEFQVLSLLGTDRRIRYYRAPQNHGVGNARAELLELARAPYACWLDSDDLCNIHRVEIQLAVMKKYKPSFVRTGRTVFGSARRAEAGVWCETPQRLHNLMKSRASMVSPSLMFDVKKAIEIGYDRVLRCGSDVVWEMKATLAHGRGLLIPMTLYHYGRGHRTRVTKMVKAAKTAPIFEKSLVRKNALCEELERELQRAGIPRWPRILSNDEMDAVLIDLKTPEKTGG
ncbi:hypothetical protein LCGC14_0624320 [marine sediment metagenome]|uniref:Glycosyltransferase 2-like domain-containing protein n=1 Tax=marine sediment metagenome TaxID=412755 RepID=A0A0F9TQC8_9ZZZZ